MVSFVIPCYNEEGNVQKIIARIHEVFDPENIETELVMVNDGSKDHTLQKLKEALSGPYKKGLKVVNFSRNFGKEAAILCGLRNATGEFVCFIDADLQQDPSYALTMYHMLLEKPELDTVAAYQEKRKESILLKFFKKNFYFWINEFSDIHFTPDASDFRVIRRNMADVILNLPEVDRFSKGIFSWVGFNAEYIPYSVQERNSGSSTWNFGKLFMYAVEGFLGYTVQPLYWPLFLGGGGTVLSFLLLITIIILSICGVAVPNHGIVLSIVLLLANIILLFMGVMGLYLAKVYRQVKNRPVYIEKDVFTEEQNV